ncbi:Transcription repressor OFP11 [Hirschfeldia incana]|nr:Transcription repressor OFP11 [Hirschfeldia incana]
MSTFLKKKLHLCFSSSGVVSPSIPSSPVVVPNDNPPSHHHTPSIFINNFNSLYDHLSVSSPLHRNDKFTSVAAALTTPKSGETGSNLFSGGLHPSPRRADDDEEDEEEDEDENYAVVSNLLSDGTAIMERIDSPDPCRDFGRSMREMVEARDPTRDDDDASDREYLNELLFCYLSLNPKHTHKFIVSAFADTLLWLHSQSSPSAESSLSRSI